MISHKIKENLLQFREDVVTSPRKDQEAFVLCAVAAVLVGVILITWYELLTKGM